MLGAPYQRGAAGYPFRYADREPAQQRSQEAPLTTSLRSLALVLVLLSAGCQSSPSAPEFAITRLYFGLSKPGGVVGPDEWRAFVDAEVTSRFPQGFTLYRAEGAWQSEAGDTAREASRVLEVLHPAEPEPSGFAELIRLYKERFQQESVLRIRTPAEASF